MKMSTDSRGVVYHPNLCLHPQECSGRYSYDSNEIDPTSTSGVSVKEIQTVVFLLDQDVLSLLRLHRLKVILSSWRRLFPFAHVNSVIQLHNRWRKRWNCSLWVWACSSTVTLTVMSKVKVNRRTLTRFGTEGSSECWSWWNVFNAPLRLWILVWPSGRFWRWWREWKHFFMGKKQGWKKTSNSTL